MVNLEIYLSCNPQCVILNEYPKQCKEVLNEPIDKEELPSIEEAVGDFRAGCEEAFDYVYRYFKPKIEYMAYSKSPQKSTDLISEINLQLLKCMKTYKFGGVKFNTYFWRCAQNAVGMFFTKLNAKKRNCDCGEISLSVKTDKEQKTELVDTIIDNKSNMHFDNILFLQTLEQSIFPLLDYKDVEIIKMCANGNDITEISRALHMTKAGIYLRLKKIKNNEKLQQPLIELKRILF